jgi:hypothetical protein
VHFVAVSGWFPFNQILKLIVGFFFLTYFVADIDVKFWICYSTCCIYHQTTPNNLELTELTIWIAN